MSGKKKLDIPLDVVKAALTFQTTHKPGAVRLDAYPLLVYAPSQWGPGVRTEDKGIPVADIAAKVAEMSDHARLAEHFGTTPAHVVQALDYVVAATPAEGG